MGTGLEVAFVLALIVANGLFSMSETAVVSARKARLQHRAAAGDAAAARAVALADDPNVFLATVQVGITLIGVFSGAFGGAALADALADPLRAVPGVGRWADPVAFGLVVVTITYLSLVVGELVPKRIALNAPEAIAARVSGPMARLSALASPVVGLLGVSTDAALRLLGVRLAGESPVTAAEVGVLLEQGARAGVFHPAERDMVTGVFALADDRVTALMTPRPDVVWLDLDAPPEATWRAIVAAAHSRFPVCRGELDQVVGVVGAKDLLAAALTGAPLDLAAHLRPPLLVPESTPVLRALERFREAGEHLAVVVDEYGGTAGLVTVQDVLEAIVGDLPGTRPVGEVDAVRRPDGSWLLDGGAAADEVAALLGLPDLPGEAERHYRTLGGLVLAELGRVPAPGDTVTWGGWRFEVVDMDGRRVDKVLAAFTQDPPVPNS